jgi:hypothetical protein
MRATAAGKGETVRQIGATRAKRRRSKRRPIESVPPNNDDQFRELVDHIRMVFFICTPEPFTIS